MSREVKYRSWVFEVDFERTKKIYQQVEKGCPESCICDNCKNFVANREQIYPTEFKNLLSELGLDYKKESEIYHMYRAENGKHSYGGWFHFKGKIKEGKVYRKESPDGEWNLNTIHINENFQVGFLKEHSLSFFDKEEFEELVQIEFYVYSDWVIDKSLESD